jgi:hypothetical protein
MRSCGAVAMCVSFETTRIGLALLSAGSKPLRFKCIAAWFAKTSNKTVTNVLITLAMPLNWTIAKIGKSEVF